MKGKNKAVGTKTAPGPASPWASVSDFGGGAGQLLEGEDAGDAIERPLLSSRLTRGASKSGVPCVAWPVCCSIL